LILQVALDESGYEASRTDDVFVFAGYIGTEPQWTDFMHKWNDIFIQHPQMRDARTFKKLVRWCGRWSDPRAVELVQAVGTSGLKSVRWRLPYSSYRKVVLNSVYGDKDNLYVFAWFAMVIRLWMEVSIRDRADTFDLIYDENINEEEKVQTGYAELIRLLREKGSRLVSVLPLRPTPRSSRIFWPVRAADALAWNTHRHFMQVGKNKRHSNPLWTALESIPSLMDDTWTATDVHNFLHGRSLLD